MDIFYYKLLVSLILFLIALGFGLLPLWLAKTTRANHFLAYSESAARGIFLGAGFIHLLPEAQTRFLQLKLDSQYPTVFAIAAFTILLLYIIEHGIAKQFGYKELKKKSYWLAYLLFILLSIHSLFEGIALGVDTHVASFILLFLAITAHKGAASFALGVNMQSNQLSNVRISQMIVLFSIITPLGVLFGASLLQVLHEEASLLFEAVFNAIAAGTFIYIAVFDQVDTEKCPEHPSHPLVKTAYFTLGLLIMSIAALWIHNGHMH